MKLRQTGRFNQNNTTDQIFEEASSILPVNQETYDRGNSSFSFPRKYEIWNRDLIKDVEPISRKNLNFEIESYDSSLRKEYSGMKNTGKNYLQQKVVELINKVEEQNQELIFLRKQIDSTAKSDVSLLIPTKIEIEKTLLDSFMSQISILKSQIGKERSEYMTELDNLKKKLRENNEQFKDYESLEIKAKELLEHNIQLKESQKSIKSSFSTMKDKLLEITQERDLYLNQVSEFKSKERNINNTSRDQETIITSQSKAIDEYKEEIIYLSKELEIVSKKLEISLEKCKKSKKEYSLLENTISEEKRDKENSSSILIKELEKENSILKTEISNLDSKYRELTSRHSQLLEQLNSIPFENSSNGKFIPIENHSETVYCLQKQLERLKVVIEKGKENEGLLNIANSTNDRLNLELNTMESELEYWKKLVESSCIKKKNISQNRKNTDLKSKDFFETSKLRGHKYEYAFGKENIFNQN